MIPFQEYGFICGGDKVTLISYANKVDIVHNEMLQSAKIKYDSRCVFPIGLRVALVIMILLSAAVWSVFGVKIESTTMAYALIFGIGNILMSSIIELSVSGNPLISNRKRIILSLLTLFWAWAVQFIIYYVFLTIQKM